MKVNQLFPVDDAALMANSEEKLKFYEGVSVSVGKIKIMRFSFSGKDEQPCCETGIKRQKKCMNEESRERM